MSADGADAASDATTAPTLAALLPEVPTALGGWIAGDATARVSAMTHDSRLVAPGHLFACVRGEHHDGHRFAAGAVEAGATALLVDHVVDVGQPVGQLVVADTRVAMGPVASGVYHHPSRALQVVGITGTNGKTTTCALLAAILRAAGRPTTVIGTLSGTKTTPEAPELQARLAAARDAGDRAVVMEASSHALALHRVDGTRFAVGVFTNLGTDHLDLHGTPEAYFRAKARLFTPELTAVGVSNADDAHGRLLLDAAPIEMVPFSLADAGDLVVTADHHELTWRGARLVVGLGGGFNVANTLAAATTAALLGITPDVIAAGLATASVVPGRFERVLPATGDGGGVVAIVDYAHTPDGLEEVLQAARAVTTGRVIVVFGAGGDRDHPKRPRMGAVAARLADVAVVTSDNPRSEDPTAIIEAVLSGIEDRAGVVVEPDRAAAIAAAVAAAGPGDVVVVAGKGHETTQTIGDRVLPFDDREVVRALLEARS
ncbi:MAG TPA: UDP-N-acetylmuramoyl-L-alanyl-D-glutamate--2,6-diaminopimelate ligase [Ilumatobacteraceae bacterium]|nr:UDP-N-acetylmuramoyl-L-alanyl-D-glutamate--2,6-diaminopimelate ligase [Ilumatobacteraceae bacterium]